MLLLNGCAQQAPTPQAKICDKQARRQYLQQLQQWQVDGRIGITEATRNVNAGFTWEQNGNIYKIKFCSPYTTETLTVTGNDNQFKVQDCNGEADPEIQLEQNLPFAQMGSWLKGIPAPSSTPQIASYDADHQLKTLQQDGWTIEYQSYLPDCPTNMPGRMTIYNDTTKTKLLIKNWQK